MKDLLKNGVLFLLAILILYVIFLRECKQSVCPPKGQVLVSQAVWDSIMNLAGKKPIVRIDTVWLKPDTVIIEKPTLPTPKPVGDSLNFYSDTLQRKDIYVSYNFTVKGTLEDRFWAYRPVIMTVRRDSIIFVPSIIEGQTLPVRAKNRLFGEINFGGNKNSFICGGGITLLTKKNTEIGYFYQKYDHEGFHNIKLGICIFGK